MKPRKAVTMSGYNPLTLIDSLTNNNRPLPFVTEFLPIISSLTNAVQDAGRTQLPDPAMSARFHLGISAAHTPRISRGALRRPDMRTR
jgi:hypothetical protein